MPQVYERYHATYCRLETKSEDQSCKVNAEAIAIGLELTFHVEHYVNSRGKDCMRGVVTNPIKQVVGYLPADCSRVFCDLQEQGWTVRIAASAVGFHEYDRSYWIEAAVFAYEPGAEGSGQEKALGAFVTGTMDRLGKGERPDIRLDDSQIDAALKNEQLYKQVKVTKYPKLPKGDAYYKRQRTQSETMIIAGNARKPGCIVGTVAAYAVIIAAVVFFVWKFVLGD